MNDKKITVRAIWLYILAALAAIVLLTIITGCTTVDCRQILEANDPDYHKEWVEATYDDMRVYQLKDFIYMLERKDGQMWYIECMSPVDMFPTYEAWLDKDNKTSNVRKLNKDKFMNSLGN